MAGASLILPYLLPMLLGRVIDLKNYDIGADIYDEVNYKETKVNVLNATYHVIKGEAFPYEYFGMPIDIVLRIKAGYLSSKSGSLGLDGLLKDTSKMHNSAVVAAMVVYNKATRQLSPDAKLLNGWKERVPKTTTHYASQMTYGGWVAVLYRFKCKIPSDVPSVYETVVKVLGESGQLKDDTAELWTKVQTAVKQNENVRGEVIIETRIYSSVKIPLVNETPKGLANTIKELPKYIEGNGIPIFMQLKPLTDIDSSFPTTTKNDDLNKNLRKLDFMWDDVMHSKSHVMRWLQNSDAIFEDEDEDKIYEFLEKLNQCIKLFKLLIGDISLFKKIDQSAIQKAFDTYNKGLDTASGAYDTMYLRLREDIDRNCEDNFLKGIKGLLKVYKNEQGFSGQVDGIGGCQKKCTQDERCRSIGFADTVSELDEKNGGYITKKNQCWVFYRSTSTATIESKGGLYGDVRVYDRYCL